MRSHRWLVNILLAVDLFMILTVYLGEQQLTAGNEILVGPKLVWGAISTLGHIIVILALLFRIWRQFAQHESAPRRAVGISADGTDDGQVPGRLLYGLHLDDD